NVEDAAGDHHLLERHRRVDRHRPPTQTRIEMKRRQEPNGGSNRRHYYMEGVESSAERPRAWHPLNEPEDDEHDDTDDQPTENVAFELADCPGRRTVVDLKERSPHESIHTLMIRCGQPRELPLDLLHVQFGDSALSETITRGKVAASFD